MITIIGLILSLFSISLAMFSASEVSADNLVRKAMKLNKMVGFSV